MKVEVVFLSAQEGGRRWPPDLAKGGYYTPHIVIQDRSVRKATTVEGWGTEDYLGVAFTLSSGDLVPGEPARCTLELVYFPRVDYTAVRPGATFTIREGGGIVGHGVVLDDGEDEIR